MAYNTGNPLGSTDARDLADNAYNFDTAVNSPNGTWVDRLGVTRSTFEGAVAGMAFFNVGDFATGYTITNSRQTLTYSGHEYAWDGLFPKLVVAGSSPTPLGAGGWIDRSDVTLRSELAAATNASDYVGGLTASTMTSTEAKAVAFKPGDKVYLSDLGYVFEYKASRYLISGQSLSEITFDDAIHVLTADGGMLQFCEFDKLRGMQAANASVFAAKLKDRTTAISVDCYGDSITFGQAQASTPNSTNKIGVATGFGDGSTHEQWQFNNNYPAWILSYFAENILQSSTVNNYGYSGDRCITGYLRHRTVSGSDAATIMYGINDCLFATSNGANPDGLSVAGLYTVENYTTALRLFAAKQIVQGKYLTILGTTPFGSLVGFDGTPYSAMKLTRAYNAAAKAVADELGCRYVDVCQDVFDQYGLGEITQEGTHLGEDGLKIAGNRIAAALVTVESENRVSSDSVIICNPNTNCMLSIDAINILGNASSTTPKGTLADERTTVNVTTNWITIPFYAETDSLVLFLNGSASAGGAVFDVYLDSNSVQSDFHFQRSYLAGKPTAWKQPTYSTPFNREISNLSDDTNPFIVVANRGWHSISVRKVSGAGSLLLDSVEFVSLETVLNSDVYGVTASCSVSAGTLDSGARNVSGVVEDFTGEFSVTLINAMASNRYTICVDVDETFADPISITTRYKTTTTFAIAFNHWTGAAWVKFQPTNFTVKVIGGR